MQRRAPADPHCRAVWERLEELVDGELLSAEAAPLEEHLARCALCSAELRRASLLVSELRALPELEPPAAVLAQVRRRTRQGSAPPRRNVPRFAAAVAATVALLLAGYGWWIAHRSDAPPATAASRAPSAEEIAAATLELRSVLARVGSAEHRAALAVRRAVGDGVRDAAIRGLRLRETAGTRSREKPAGPSPPPPAPDSSERSSA
jgi:anti-sigma factor RsiW